MKSFRIIFKVCGQAYNFGRIICSADGSLYLSVKNGLGTTEVHKSENSIRLGDSIRLPDESSPLPGKYTHMSYHATGQKHTKLSDSNGNETYHKLPAGQKLFDPPKPIHLWTIVPPLPTKLPVINKCDTYDKWFEPTGELYPFAMSIYVWPRNEKLAQFTFPDEGIRKKYFLFDVHEFQNHLLVFMIYSPARSKTFPEKAFILTLGEGYVPIISDIDDKTVEYVVRVLSSQAEDESKN